MKEMHEFLSTFKPHHITANREDMEGNGGKGRFVFLPGSDGRAREIADHFSNVTLRPSARAHNLYLGTLNGPKGPIDVASVASGMGTPSLDIIATELILLGVRGMLRVGTAGSLQHGRVRVGDLVIANAAVRDEGASRNYAPLEFPAVASADMVQSAQDAGRVLGLPRVHTGVVHCKDSLFAREFGLGPDGDAHEAYMKRLRRLGVVASEMESSHLFVLAAVHSQAVRETDAPVNSASSPVSSDPVSAGAILAIIGDDSPFADPATVKATTESAILLALETCRRFMCR